MAIKEVKVPDLGGSELTVLEILIKVGDKVKAETSVVTLESEKATVDVPSPDEGTVQDIKIKVGDKISEGSVILTLEIAGAENITPVMKAESQPTVSSANNVKPPENKSAESSASGIETNAIYASPSVRRLASELGINLANIKATGEKGRLTKEDIHGYIKNRMQGTGAASGFGLPTAPVVDFNKFGETEIKPLTRVNKFTVKNMQRNWLLVPHVTQFDEADITEMEAFRIANKSIAEKQGAKLTPLIFIMKAVAAALKNFPRFNSSLDANNENLILKKYCHIGVAVDTPDGLVVPVIRDVDKKGIFSLAKELAEISVKAREGKLLPAEMQGGCFTISSLGGIGGTAFTPIVNVPEVAILGVSRSTMKSVYNGKEFQPRLMLPLSLSYDHRVIDGAEGARFIVCIGEILSDIRRLILQ